ncbi:hypothetical protein PSEUBRA_004757 [Kalmanozyma brasiliensis GHG001]|uniref:uncharacterized protein n=1 Tax=Kalmanozyma brasiliensis (strain GHG001) TaxID=1365824 RepID=UPI002867D658|nr:uncharacterized protein PSEUBRA_004757 [Kalmanozyma brasiliensis GHG001]KAF6767422.1 hypothetical protein PSEUBRA_004757 [Kalmanozyma brasiliensis GHG001]
MPVSITNATSFVPLSEVTHLHFISLTPPECLIAFLVGNADMIKAFGQPLAAQMQADIASGHSPNEKLECLRLSQLPEEALHHFGEYIAWRKATDAFSQLSPAKQALRTPLDEPDVLMEISGNSTVRDILYDLAVNSCRLPRLRLLILDTQLCPLTPPKDALKLLVEQGALTDVSKRFPGLPQSGCGCGSQEHYATTFVSSLFNDMKQNSEDGDSMNATNLLRSDEEAKSWSRLLDSMDEHWRLTQEGKHALIKLWNSSRSKNATNATVPVHTEIRIAAGRHCNLTSDELERDFHCAVENLKSPPTASSSNSKHDSGASHDLGLWADPDVFSVIETRPWLPYLQLNQYGCCFWTGELPRDNDASSRLPGSQSIVNPPIVPLDEAKLDEQAKLELERLKRARAMDELVEAKRQRIEAAGLDQSEPSIH